MRLSSQLTFPLSLLIGIVQLNWSKKTRPGPSTCQPANGNNSGSFVLQIENNLLHEKKITRHIEMDQFSLCMMFVYHCLLPSKCWEQLLSDEIRISPNLIMKLQISKYFRMMDNSRDVKF